VTDVALKEYFDGQLRDLRESLSREIKHERELRGAWIRGTDAALALQKIETERRLDGLNHEAARLAADKATYLSRDIFFTWREEHDKDTAALAATSARATGATEAKQRMWGLVVMTGSVLLNVVYGFFTGRAK